ncbi:MAG: hypothetical protein AAF843_06570 [Bacteroidota bacterium]
MPSFSTIVLMIHIAAGAIALLVAPVAMIVKKGGKRHSFWGLIFFWAMTVIFGTALYLSTVKWIPFLLMIAVFSYYSVLSAYRWKFLKGLHDQSQKPLWFDWIALIVNGLINAVFIIWGGYLLIKGLGGALPYLALGFGFIGIRISTKNLKLFRNTHHPKTWLFEHLSGMVGGFIATVTAFSAQVMSFMPTFLQWSWPTLVGAPLIAYWLSTYRKKYKVEAI